MGYNANDSEKKLLNAGNYEALIINADIRTTSTGKEFLNVCFNVPSENENVYTKIFRDAATPSEFNKKRVGQLLKALKITRDVNSDFDLIQVIKDKRCVINVTKEYNDFFQNEENNIKLFKQSDLQQPDNSQPVAQPQPTINVVDIKDEDLPF